MTSNIQSVIFNKKYYTCTTARNWLKKKKLKPIKRVDKTDKYLRYRINSPSKYKSFTTKSTSDNLKLIIGFIK